MAAVKDYKGQDCRCHCRRTAHLSIRVMKPGTYIVMGVGLAVAVLLGFLVGQRCPRNAQGETPTPKVDTLFIRDTNSFTEPKKEPSPDVLIKEIPVPVYVADSSAIDSLLNECARLERVGDSLQLVLLREQRHYSDSTFDAWVSGVDPRLDSIKTYQTNMVITKEIPVIQVKKTRWGLGIQAGIGTGMNGKQVYLTPYVGVGISYNILSW